MSTAKFIAAEIYNGYCPFLEKPSKKIWPRHSLLQRTNTISNKCYCHHFKELHLLLKDYISRLWLSGQAANTQKEKRCCQVSIDKRSGEEMIPFKISSAAEASRLPGMHLSGSMCTPQVCSGQPHSPALAKIFAFNSNYLNGSLRNESVKH